MLAGSTPETFCSSWSSSSARSWAFAVSKEIGVKTNYSKPVTFWRHFDNFTQAASCFLVFAFCENIGFFPHLDSNDDLKFGLWVELEIESFSREHSIFQSIPWYLPKFQKRTKSRTCNLCHLQMYILKFWCRKLAHTRKLLVPGLRTKTIYFAWASQ